MDDCVFCNFQDKGVIVYEDEKCFCAVSLNPINKYHLMVIPKEHLENFVDLPDELISHLFIVAKKISLALRKTCKPLAIHHISDDEIGGKGYNLISHYKIHIIPRFENDKVIMEWNRYDLSPQERAKIADEVKENL